MSSNFTPFNLIITYIKSAYTGKKNTMRRKKITNSIIAEFAKFLRVERKIK